MGHPALVANPFPRLLLVDDDVRTARLLASMLEEDGFAVEVMGDGAEAVSRLAREPRPDAIITDLIMPGASGIAVLGEARRRFARIPVIFVTGHPDLLMRWEIPYEPCPVLFTKPLSYSAFRARLGELLPPKAPETTSTRPPEDRTSSTMDGGSVRVPGSTS